MTTLTSSIKVSISALLEGAAGMFTPSVNLNNVVTESISSTQGTFLYTDAVSTAAANKTYDLIGASAGLDPFGVSVDIDRIAAILIENTHATTYIHVTGLPAAMVKGTTPDVIIPPGGVFCWACPTGVVNTTDIVITGRNAADDANVNGTWEIAVIGKHE